MRQIPKTKEHEKPANGSQFIQKSVNRKKHSRKKLHELPSLDIYVSKQVHMNLGTVWLWHNYLMLNIVSEISEFMESNVESISDDGSLTIKLKAGSESIASALAG